MAITNFIPEVWSAELLSILRKTLVYAGAGAVNRDYEGDIANYGDTVHITALDDPDVFDYIKGTEMSVAQSLTDTGQTLLVDQAKAFNFQIDDIDMRQAASGGAMMSEAASRGAFKLADAADQYVAALMQAGASSDNDLGTVAVSSPSLFYTDVLVPLAQKLDEANVPSQGRFAVVSPAAYSQLLLDNRFILANESGSPDGLHNGNVGNALGFTILKSNNAPTDVRTITDGVTTSSSKTLTSATANFNAEDVGALVDDGNSKITTGTTIASVQSATSVTMSGTSKAAGTAIHVTIGTAGSTAVIAGSSIATTYAEQINKVVAYQPEKQFSDALKGLHLYGAKVVRPEAIAVASVVIS